MFKIISEFVEGSQHNPPKIQMFLDEGWKVDMITSATNSSGYGCYVTVILVKKEESVEGH